MLSISVLPTPRHLAGPMAQDHGLHPERLLTIAEASGVTSTPIHDPRELVSPLAPISPWPPEEPLPRGPASDLPSAKEVYGSLAVLLTYLAYAVYLVWAFAPASWLDSVGWTWYPDR